MFKFKFKNKTLKRLEIRRYLISDMLKDEMIMLRKTKTAIDSGDENAGDQMVELQEFYEERGQIIEELMELEGY